MSADPGPWITILAGGVGSRFWPVSTPSRPKQLLPLASDRPLIADTVQRARALAADSRIRILAGAHLADPFRGALPDLPRESYLLEPRAKGTCPALTWAAWEISRLDPDAVLVSLHADHLIEPLQAFAETLAAAITLARDHDLLVTVGVPPDRVETGFGHIQPGEPLDTGGTAEAFRVRAFHEKPDAETAGRYMDAGFVWNSGIFVWKARTFLDEVRAHTPEVAAHLPALETGGPGAFFDAVPSCVVDTAVLERSHRVGCVRATFRWDDVGSWEALARTRTPDADGNVVEGRGLLVQASGNVVFADEGEVVVFGAHDLVVVRTGERTLVLPRHRAADLKTLLDTLGDDA